MQPKCSAKKKDLSSSFFKRHSRGPSEGLRRPSRIIDTYIEFLEVPIPVRFRWFRFRKKIVGTDSGSGSDEGRFGRPLVYSSGAYLYLHDGGGVEFFERGCTGAVEGASGFLSSDQSCDMANERSATTSTTYTYSFKKSFRLA